MPKSRLKVNKNTTYCRGKMKVSAFSKIEMSSLGFAPEVFHESGDFTYEQAGTSAFRGYVP
ncbi:MAG: hypothetical protein R8M46_09185, partial [Ghiorsea sp.]